MCAPAEQRKDRRPGRPMQRAAWAALHW